MKAGRLNRSIGLDPRVGCILDLPLRYLDGDSFMSRDVYGHVCTPRNGAKWTLRGYHMDGVDDYVEIPDSPLWAFGSKDFFIEVSFELDTLTQDIWWVATFWSHTDGGGLVNKFYFSWDAETDRLIFHINSPAAEEIAVRSEVVGAVAKFPIKCALRRIGDIWPFLWNEDNKGSPSQVATVHDASLRTAVGYGEGTGGFEGTIFEVRIRAL